ncbi:lipopolysaccharide biosynthesis protein [Microbacterium hydrocarbonoxydans]|uniref:lipopolysaccharide biosynthesis protein n=1 Tax=Microbacterium hydrocarbonoxydans TaxID=273678 RepID=UPI003D989561
MKSEGLARSGLISLFGSAFAALAALLLTAIVGNTLGADGTGLFFQAMGVFTILTQVLRLGTNSGIVRYIAEQRAFHRAGAEWRIVMFAVGPVAVISGLVSLGVWLLADALGAWLATPEDAAAMADLLRAMVPYVVMGALIGVLQIGARMLRGVAAFTLLQSILLPASRLLTVLLAVSFAGVAAWGAFEAWLLPLPFWLIVTVATIAMPFVRDFRRRGESTRETRPTFSGFWRFNAPRTVSSGLETALEWSDVLIIAALASPSSAGVYAVITRAVRAGGVVDKAMRVAVSPTISALLAREDYRESTRLHTSVVRAMILMNWPFYMLLVSMGPAVLGIFGAEFRSGWGPMVLLSLAMMFQTACGMLQSILLQGGKSTWQMYNKAIALGLSIGGNLALVPLLGVWGAAVTWMIVVVTDNLIAAVQVHHRMHVDLQPTRLIAPMLPPVLVFGGGGFLVTWWAGSSLIVLLLAGAALCVVYAAVLWLLRRPLHVETLWRRIPFIGRWA